MIKNDVICNTVKYNTTRELYIIHKVAVHGGSSRENNYCRPIVSSTTQLCPQVPPKLVLEIRYKKQTTQPKKVNNKYIINHKQYN